MYCTQKTFCRGKFLNFSLNRETFHFSCESWPVDQQQISLQTATLEPHLSDSHLSVPSIIWNDVQKFLKQAIPNC